MDRAVYILISPKQLDCRNKKASAGTVLRPWISHAGGGAVHVGKHFAFQE